jgi:hypothetical protein
MGHPTHRDGSFLLRDGSPDPSRWVVVGSLTKQFTSLAILKLETRKALITDKARKFLRELDQRFDAIAHSLLEQNGAGRAGAEAASAATPARARNAGASSGQTQAFQRQPR